MSTQQKFEIQSVIEAIRRVGASPSAVAKELNTTRSTINRYRKRYPEIAQAMAGPGTAAPVEWTKHSEQAVREAIEQSHGVKAAVAAALGCSRASVDNYLERWPELAELLEAQRHKLIGFATSALADDIADKKSKGHQSAYMFALKTLGKEDGFTERQEVTGKDGANLLAFSPDVVRLAAVMGVDLAAELRKFEGMVKTRAAEMGVVASG